MNTPPISTERLPTTSSIKEKVRAPQTKFCDLLKRDAKEEKSEDRESVKEPHDPQEGAAPLPFPFQTIFTAAPEPLATSATAAIYELLEKMTSEIVIMQKEGVTTTHLSLKTEHLSEIELSIRHYDSDPAFFQIELRGNEEAGIILQKQQMALANELQKALPQMHCEITTSFYAAPTPIKTILPKKAVVKSEKIGYCPVRRVKEVL